MTDTATTTTNLTHHDNTGNVGLPQVGNSPPLRSDESNTFADETPLPDTSASIDTSNTRGQRTYCPAGKIETVFDKPIPKFPLSEPPTLHRPCIRVAFPQVTDIAKKYRVGANFTDPAINST